MNMADASVIVFSSPVFVTLGNNVMSEDTCIFKLNFIASNNNNAMRFNILQLHISSLERKLVYFRYFVHCLHSLVLLYVKLQIIHYVIIYNLY